IIMMIFLLSNIKRISSMSSAIYLLFTLFWVIYIYAIIREIYDPSPVLIFSPFTYLSYSFIYCIIPFVFFSVKHSPKTFDIFREAIILSGIILAILTCFLYGKFLLAGIGRLSEIR